MQLRGKLDRCCSVVSEELSSVFPEKYNFLLILLLFEVGTAGADGKMRDTL